jgi:hypothetical protein
MTKVTKAENAVQGAPVAVTGGGCALCGAKIVNKIHDEHGRLNLRANCDECQRDLDATKAELKRLADAFPDNADTFTEASGLLIRHWRERAALRAKQQQEVWK